MGNAPKMRPEGTKPQKTVGKRERGSTSRNLNIFREATVWVT